MSEESGDSGASKTIPMQCSSLRQGGYVMLKGFPCKIVEMSTSKTGKHGHAKVHLVGIDIFTGKKYEDLSPSTHNMEVPQVSRNEYQLLDIEGDGYLSVLTQTGETRNDLKLPSNPEEASKIKEAFDSGSEITIVTLSAVGEEQVVNFKVSGTN